MQCKGGLKVRTNSPSAWEESPATKSWPTSLTKLSRGKKRYDMSEFVSDDELRGIKRCPSCGNIVFQMPTAMVVSGIATMTCGCGQRVDLHGDGTVSASIQETCMRCGYVFYPKNGLPKTCPNKKCRSPYWNKPRTKGLRKCL